MLTMQSLSILISWFSYMAILGWLMYCFLCHTMQLLAFDESKAANSAEESIDSDANSSKKVE